MNKAFDQEPITRSLHLYCALESTLSNEELFLEQAFPRKFIVSEDVNVNEYDWAAHWLVDSLLRFRAWKILRTDWLIGYYALVRDKFCPKTVSINNFLSERVDSEGLYGRWRLRVMGSCFDNILQQVYKERMKKLMLDAKVVLRTSHMAISFGRKEMYLSAFRSCNTIIFLIHLLMLISSLIK